MMSRSSRPAPGPGPESRRIKGAAGLSDHVPYGGLRPCHGGLRPCRSIRAADAPGTAGAARAADRAARPRRGWVAARRVRVVASEGHADRRGSAFRPDPEAGGRRLSRTEQSDRHRLAWAGNGRRGPEQKQAGTVIRTARDQPPRDSASLTRTPVKYPLSSSHEPYPDTQKTRGL